MGMTTTRETVHGLLRLENNQLTIQWRLGRKTEHIGSEMRTDKEVEAVETIVVPISEVSGSVVRRRWWDFMSGGHLVLTATDFRAFEALAGKDGLSLDHPAVLSLGLQRSNRLVAEEFSAELALAVAEYAVYVDEDGSALEGSQRRPELKATNTSLPTSEDGPQRVESGD